MGSKIQKRSHKPNYKTDKKEAKMLRATTSAVAK